jgi:hypothetical protein
VNASVVALFARPVDTVGKQIRQRIAGRVSDTRLHQAIARAERLVASGMAQHRAIERVVSWALCADPDPFPPKPLAA